MDNNNLVQPEPANVPAQAPPIQPSPIQNQQIADPPPRHGKRKIFIAIILLILIVIIGGLVSNIYSKRLVTVSTNCFSLKVPANFDIKTPNGGQNCNLAATFDVAADGSISAQSINIVMAPTGSATIQPQTTPANPNTQVSQTTVGGFQATVEKKQSNGGGKLPTMADWNYLIQTSKPYKTTSKYPTVTVFAMFVIAPPGKEQLMTSIVDSVQWK